MAYVLKLCGWYPSRVDAFNGDFVQRHARAIATQIQVVVLFAVKDPSLRSKTYERRRNRNGLLDEWIYYYPQRRWFDKWWSQWYYLRILQDAKQNIRATYGKPMLIHVNIVWRAAIWAMRLKKWKVPVVITENSTEYQKEAKVNIRTASFFKKGIFEKVFANCQLFIPVTHQLGTMVQQLYGPIPYCVVPNVVDTTLFTPTEKKDAGSAFHLLHVSTMNHQKNIEGVLRVLGTVLQNENLHCTMVGPLTDELKHWQAMHPQFAGRLTCTGWIPYEAVAQLVKNADLLFLFSRYENLPCVILEALCAGIPVVSTNVGGIAEVIDESNGILVESENEIALENAIVSVVNGVIMYNKSAIANAAQEKYNYEKIGKAFVAAYRKAGVDFAVDDKPKLRTA